MIARALCLCQCERRERHLATRTSIPVRTWANGNALSCGWFIAVAAIHLNTRHSARTLAHIHICARETRTRGPKGLNAVVVALAATTGRFFSFPQRSDFTHTHTHTGSNELHARCWVACFSFLVLVAHSCCFNYFTRLAGALSN